MAIIRNGGNAEPALQNVNDKMEGRVIMGIDPGTNFMGYGFIKVEGGKPICVAYGVIKLNKFGDAYQKLAHIFARVSGLIVSYSPDEVALEAPFYGTNVQSMLKLGRAQGVAMAAALSRSIDVFEYAPTRVKQSVAGAGRASKEQIADIVSRTLAIKLDEAEKLDATDALSVALCHYYGQCSPIPTASSSSKGSGWQTFLTQHPDRKF